MLDGALSTLGTRGDDGLGGAVAVSLFDAFGDEPGELVVELLVDQLLELRPVLVEVPADKLAGTIDDGGHPRSVARSRARCASHSSTHSGRMRISRPAPVWRSSLSLTARYTVIGWQRATSAASFTVR